MVYLGLGSNLGDRVAWLRRGLFELGAAGVSVTRISPLYLTEPVLGGAAVSPERMPWFVNCVVAVAPSHRPEALLRVCLEAERRCGRLRTGTGPDPRPLDVDVLLYNDEVVDSPGLRIPHPRLHQRRFVLRPLADIDAEARHPVLGASAVQMLAGLDEGAEGIWLLAPGEVLLPPVRIP
jgi:2-amino-4-hydroxy-6-hydroxymethyldihydropteridine diphosphokinase